MKLTQNLEALLVWLSHFPLQISYPKQIYIKFVAGDIL